MQANTIRMMAMARRSMRENDGIEGRIWSDQPQIGLV
jgi:hypothetical protein